jgi:CRP-like cAMP-binding protein
MPDRRTARSTSLVEAASLSSVDLFKGLPASCLEALEQHSEVRDHRSGHVFFRTSETGQRLFLLEKGRVQTFRVSGKHKLIIAELKPPAIFGEMAFVGQCMYHCSAQTTKNSSIRIIGRADGDCVEDLTHKEIAGQMRVYRESVTTALGELRKAGIIAVDRKRIRVLDRVRLERASRE